MSTVVHVPTTFQAMTAFRRFTVAEYQKLIDTGVLTDEDEVELLEGHLVLKMPADPPHDAAMTALDYFLQRLLPPGFLVRCQHGSDFPDSRPEPDIAVVRGDLRTFRTRHPEPADMALVIEVSDSSLARDRIDKGRIYARANIPEYWVVNLVDRQVEVYTDPTGPVSAPVYRRRQDYPPGASVPLVLDGVPAGAVSVSEVLA
jgi:Uma2 family endonuclease